MSLLTDLQVAVRKLDYYVQSMSQEFEPPVLTPLGFRHHPVNFDHKLAAFLKCVRIVSCLNASVSLLKEGYSQEVYILCRAIDEANEDILFFLFQLNDQAKKDQVRLLKEFYQEELEDQANPLSNSKRDRVPRRNIARALYERSTPSVSSEEMKKVSRSIYQTFSCFVHGAYVFIMEMYGGFPAKYHTAGMLNTPRFQECSEQLVNNVYRSFISAELVAKVLGLEHLRLELRNFSSTFAIKHGCVRL